MSDDRIGINSTFRREASVISPANAYSAMTPGRQRERPLSVADWIAREMEDGRDLGAGLLRQLEGKWEGLPSQAPVRRALLGVLAVVSLGGAQPLVARLNQAAVGGRDVVSLAEDAVLAAGSLPADLIEACAAGHAWSGTVACSVVEAAKKGAPVVPPSNFLWMADLDRTLWLLLSCHGRHASYPEVAGIRAIHHAETVMGRPLCDPWFGPLERAFGAAA